MTSVDIHKLAEDGDLTGLSRELKQFPNRVNEQDEVCMNIAAIDISMEETVVVIVSFILC